MIGRLTSAIKNVQWKDRRSPRSNRRVHSPYVLIVLPLAAKSLTGDGMFFADFDGGTTETSAPVSIRNVFLDEESEIRMRLTSSVVEPNASVFRFVVVFALECPWSLRVSSLLAGRSVDADLRLTSFLICRRVSNESCTVMCSCERPYRNDGETYT